MPLRFTLRQLEYFVAVGECGSIALASERVNVSSPSISVAIAQLEAAFDLPLFVRRHAHGLALTQGGRRFMDEARELLARAARLGDLANEITSHVRGPLTVGCLVSFAQMVLPTLRRTFVTAHPEVEFRQVESHQAEIFAALRTAQIDIALTYDLNIPSDLEFQPLAHFPPYAMLDPTHPLATRESLSPGDLVPYPMVLLDLPMSGEYLLSFFDGLGIRPTIVERTRDIAVVQSLVANGIGYSIANIRPPTERAPDGRPLAFVPLEGPVRAMRMGLLVAADGPAAMTVRAFRDHCRNTLAQGGVPGLWGSVEQKSGL